jgi:hypothetical protein
LHVESTEGIALAMKQSKEVEAKQSEGKTGKKGAKQSK